LPSRPPPPLAGFGIREQLLRPGGSVEPLELVSNVLGGRSQLQHVSGGWAPQPDALLAALADGRGGAQTARL
jgi:hypothetical protein